MVTMRIRSRVNGVLNNWVIQELLLADLVKTQYTCDDEGPYSRIQPSPTSIMSYIVIFSINYGIENA